MVTTLYNFLTKAGYYLAFLWMVMIYILLVMPAKDIPSPSFLTHIHFDKFVHFSLFGTLVALWTIPYASRHTTQKNTRFFLLICLGASAYGAGMEWVQLKFTADRDYENMDILADSIGAITGMIISMLWVRAEKRKAH
jgi:VanZ family protein